MRLLTGKTTYKYLTVSKSYSDICICLTEQHTTLKNLYYGLIARRLRAKIWHDCAIPDTSMKVGTVVDHD